MIPDTVSLKIERMRSDRQLDIFAVEVGHRMAPPERDSHPNQDFGSGLVVGWDWCFGSCFSSPGSSVLMGAPNSGGILTCASLRRSNGISGSASETDATVGMFFVSVPTVMCGQ